jgi:predicted nucleic acid-binding protein
MIALDASALLAFLLRERGHQKVREVLGRLSGTGARASHPRDDRRSGLEPPPTRH